MGEESLTPVYIGNYKGDAIKFEPLGKFEVTDAHTDIENAYPDDIVAPIRRIQTAMEEPITVTAFLQKKGLRGFYKAVGMPAYLRTEYLFPKKKKRGTARRKRKVKVYEQRFIKFINDKYGGDLINELPAFAGPFEGEEDI